MKFRKHPKKKPYILPIIFSIVVMLAVFVSCSVEGSVYRIQYPKFAFTPYTFSSGVETGHAEVTFLTPYDTDFPKVVEINGNIYYVAVFNGYKENEDLSQIMTINVDDCIQAINSHAYEHATNITTLSLYEDVIWDRNMLYKALRLKTAERIFGCRIIVGHTSLKAPFVSDDGNLILPPRIPRGSAPWDVRRKRYPQHIIVHFVI